MLLQNDHFLNDIYVHSNRKITELSFTQNVFIVIKAPKEVVNRPHSDDVRLLG